jgi:hypothetical protein
MIYHNEPKDASSVTHADGVTYKEHEQNLMIVYAVEGYAKRHNLSEQETRSLYWFENAEFLVDEYYREQAGVR